MVNSHISNITIQGIIQVKEFEGVYVFKNFMSVIDSETEVFSRLQVNDFFPLDFSTGQEYMIAEEFNLKKYSFSIGYHSIMYILDTEHE